jgi:hypothetical protein
MKVTIAVLSLVLVVALVLTAGNVKIYDQIVGFKDINP